MREQIDKLLKAADAVVAASRIDLSAEGISSVARLPAQLVDDLAEAINVVNRAKEK